MNDKIKQLFRANFLYMIIFVLCAVYLLLGLVQVMESGKTIWQIVADSAISLLFGFSITKLFDLQGLRKGEFDQRMIATYNLHSQEVNLCTPMLDKGDEWCETMNKDAYRKVRTKMLARVGLKYDKYRGLFGEDEALVDLSTFSKKQLKVIRKAQKLRLAELSISELTSEGGKDDNPYFMGRTKQDYEKQSTISELFSKIVVGFISGYYTLDLVEEFDWGSFIFVAIQIVLFIGFGAIKHMQSFLFVVDEYRNRVIRKINYLQMFRYANSEVVKDGKE